MTYIHDTTSLFHTVAIIHLNLVWENKKTVSLKKSLYLNVKKSSLKWCVTNSCLYCLLLSINIETLYIVLPLPFEMFNRINILNSLSPCHAGTILIAHNVVLLSLAGVGSVPLIIFSRQALQAFRKKKLFQFPNPYLCHAPLRLSCGHWRHKWDRLRWPGGRKTGESWWWTAGGMPDTW